MSQIPVKLSPWMTPSQSPSAKPKRSSSSISCGVFGISRTSQFEMTRKERRSGSFRHPLRKPWQSHSPRTTTNFCTKHVEQSSRSGDQFQVFRRLERRERLDKPLESNSGSVLTAGSWIVAFTATGNHRSRRVMEKLGMTDNPADDFEHPRVPEGHPLRPHVLYRLTRT